MSADIRVFNGNRLLDRLPAAERERLLAASKPMSFRAGHEIYRQGAPINHVYFPQTGVCSVVVLTNDGKAVETATLGAEAMLGLPAFLAMSFAPYSCIYRIGGEALCLAVDPFLEETRRGPALEALMRRYTAYRLRYSSQSIVCNTLHTVEQRACRWLLMTHDRTNRDDFLLTHEFLAEMLGVHRQTVSVVAAALQRAGLITYKHGAVRVLRRQGLEDAACECYHLIKELYDRIVQPAK